MQSPTILPAGPGAPPSTGPGAALSPRAILGWATVFAVSAALIVLLCTARLTYPLLFDPDSTSVLQPAHPPAIYPAAAAWTPRTRETIEEIGRVAPGVFLIVIALPAWLIVYGLLRALNPTFRLTAGFARGSALLTKTYIHSPPSIKAFLMAVTAGVPILVFWAFHSERFGDSPGAMAFRCAVIGAVAWVLFSRDGMADDYDGGGYPLPRSRRRLLELLGCGAAAGAIASTVLSAPAPLSPAYLLAFQRSLGIIGEADWWRCAAGASFGAALLCGSCGLAALPLTRPGGIRRGWHLMALGLLSTVAVQLVGRAIPAGAAWWFDYVPAADGGRSLGLRERLGPSGSASADHHFVLLTPSRALPFRVIARDDLTGALVDEPMIDRLQRIGAARRSALSAPAAQALRTASNLSWDPDNRCLSIFRAVETATGDAQAALDLLTILRESRPSPTTRSIAARLANPQAFLCPSAEAARALGDALARQGLAAAAQARYREADMPASRARQRAQMLARPTTGSVRGRLVVNGRPVAGARIACAAAGADLIRQMAALPNGSRDPLLPRVLEVIQSSARTGPDGTFMLDGLPAGDYALFAADANWKPLPTVVRAVPSLSAITVNDSPTDVGAINLGTR